MKSIYGKCHGVFKQRGPVKEGPEEQIPVSTLRSTSSSFQSTGNIAATVNNPSGGKAAYQ
jgi:hypothetical protein